MALRAPKPGEARGPCSCQSTWSKHRADSLSRLDANEVLADETTCALQDPMNPRWKNLALPAIMLWALLTRLWDLGQPFIGNYAWNEVYYAYIARSFLHGDLLRQPDILYRKAVFSPPLVPWLMYGSFRIFGTEEWAARLPALILGMVTLLLFFLLVRDLSNLNSALASTFLAATAPGIVFFSRSAQLDGIMTTFGFAALLTMLAFRRKGQSIWLGASLVAFALAMTAKQTAILFWPALAWIYFDDGSARNDKLRWPTMLIYTGLALAPVLLWSVFSRYEPLAEAPPTPAGQELTWLAQYAGTGERYSLIEYLFRFREWTFANFQDAFLSLWPNLSHHLGTAVWYAGLFLAIVALPRARPVTAKRFGFLAVMIGPWFLQLAYPRSWVLNEYYDYPALYMICFLLASLGLGAYRQISTKFALSDRRLTFIVGASIGLILLSNAWDYRAYFHSSYHPWPIVDQPTPFHSARQVAALNESQEPVLTDLPFTLYYTEAELEHGVYLWWEEPEARTVEAIESREFQYLVFTYRPPIDVVNAINASGYKQFAPAAWHRLPEE